MKELQEKLRSTIMIRRLKEEVLEDLPPKNRNIIELQGKNAYKLNPEEYSEAIKKLEEGEISPDLHWATQRRELGMEKVPFVVSYILEKLESVPKLVVFAYHKNVIAAIEKALTEKGVGVLTITGKTPSSQRQTIVEAFQTDAHINVFLGNIRAAGTGVTLTAASNEIFVEQDWNPGMMLQAEDRCHRIGQKNSVNIEHLVFNNSIDAIMAKVLIDKMKIQEEALDERLDSEIDFFVKEILGEL